MGTNNRVIRAVTSLRAGPGENHSIATECLLGEAFLVERTESDWLLGTLATDGYRGWVRGADVAAMPEPTHRVSVVRTLVLAAAELKKNDCLRVVYGVCCSIYKTVSRLL